MRTRYAVAVVTLAGATIGLTAVPADAATLFQDRIGSCYGHTFGPGSRSGCVRLIQKAVGEDTDGDYGPRTEAAVRRFQGYYGFQVSGITGPDQWGALCSNLSDVPRQYAGCWS